SRLGCAVNGIVVGAVRECCEFVHVVIQPGRGLWQANFPCLDHACDRVSPTALVTVHLYGDDRERTCILQFLDQALTAGSILNQNLIRFIFIRQPSHAPLQLWEFDFAAPKPKQVVAVVCHAPGRASRKIVLGAHLERSIPGLNDALEWWCLAVIAPPLSFENRPFRSGWPLLVERSKGGTPNFSSTLFQSLERIFLGPKRFTGSAETLVNLGDGGQTDDIPIFATLP